MMRKLLVLLLSVAMTAGMFAGCGKAGGSPAFKKGLSFFGKASSAVGTALPKVKPMLAHSSALELFSVAILFRPAAGKAFSAVEALFSSTDKESACVFGENVSCPANAVELFSCACTSCPLPFDCKMTSCPASAVELFFCSCIDACSISLSIPSLYSPA